MFGGAMFDETLVDFAPHQHLGRPAVTVLTSFDLGGYGISTYPLDCEAETSIAYGYAEEEGHADTIYELRTGQRTDVRWLSGRLQ